MMSQQSKRELVVIIRPRYQKGNRKQKARILDEFVATTGYHRKYAIRVLSRPGKPKVKKETWATKDLSR